MAENIILTKQSGENEIRNYFKAILALSKSDNEFPVNLDEVWMLVYSEKGKAVRALKESFIENIDYKVFTKNGKNPLGGRPVSEYVLSVPCLEFFIARKIRSVFEVYRQVFHHKINALGTATPKKKEETPIDLDKYGRVELAELLLESDGELGDALEELERKKEEVAVLKYRISQMEKGVQPSADNRMEQRLERLEKMVAALVGGQRPMKAWKDTDISEMEHSPEYYSEFPNYEYVSYLTPTPAEVYRSMDLEDVRIRLWKDTRIEMSPCSLQKYLCANGYLEETANERLKPTRQAEAYGYVFASEPEKDEKTGATVYRPLFTEKGYLRLIETIKREGVKP